MPGRRPRDVRDAVQRLLDDAGLRARLAAAGRETAERYALPRKLDELDAFFRDLAERRASGRMPSPVVRAAPAPADVGA
jgi:hypothetical protein